MKTISTALVVPVVSEEKVSQSMCGKLFYLSIRFLNIFFQFVTVDDVRILRDIGENKPVSCSSHILILLSIEQYYSTQIVSLVLSPLQISYHLLI